MYSFKNDYSEGAHPRILDALINSNMDQEAGYGEDSHTKNAVSLIKKKLNREDVDIHFISGGTQANLTVISSILRPHESVISADSGHIAVHEAGAIEFTGHKINTVATPDGKLTSDLIKVVLDEHTDEHMVKPRLVFISNSTEVGTIYTKSELVGLRKFCDEHNLLIYMDGARLGSALASKENDLTFEDITKLVDVFYIGGTKNGALLGEAIVIVNNSLKVEFRHSLKQKGALLAKGRVVAIQFEELFKDDLYIELAQNADLLAEKLTTEIRKLDFNFLAESSTNQIFPILPNGIIDTLLNDFDFYVWKKIDDKKSAIRLVTSWATEPAVVEQLLSKLQYLTKD